MKNSKTRLHLLRHRGFRNGRSGICESFSNPEDSGHIRLYETTESSAKPGLRILRDPAHPDGKPQRQFRAAIGVFVCLLAAVASYAYVGVRGIKNKGGETKERLLWMESWRMAGVEGFINVHAMVNRLLGTIPHAGEQVSQDLQKAEALSEQDLFIRQEIAALLKEFGAEDYSIPPEFVAGVDRFIRLFQERDREHLTRALVAERANLERIRAILAEHNLPQDLSYMVLVESGFLHSSKSRNGAVGLWQFTEVTARDYGMEVNETVDERRDLSKSTAAASRYLRDLILDFGTGSSVMLAIAAYNGGPERVRRAVRNLKDPIRQRNFWHLYRTGLLPAETREYVPKVIAASIIGRNPERFGYFPSAAEGENH